MANKKSTEGTVREEEQSSPFDVGKGGILLLVTMIALAAIAFTIFGGADVSLHGSESADASAGDGGSELSQPFAGDDDSETEVVNKYYPVDDIDELRRSGGGGLCRTWYEVGNIPDVFLLENVHISDIKIKDAIIVEFYVVNPYDVPKEMEYVKIEYAFEESAGSSSASFEKQIIPAKSKVKLTTKGDMDSWLKMYPEQNLKILKIRFS